MEAANIYEALIITCGVIIAQVAISWRSQNIIMYRLNQLEVKQDKHNCLVERMAVAENAIKAGHHRMDNMEKKMDQ